MSNIAELRELPVYELLDRGYDMEDIREIGVVFVAWYAPSNNTEYTDGRLWYNCNGDVLRDPSEYDTSSEGYTPFGDE